MPLSGKNHPFELILNPSVEAVASYGTAQAGILNEEGLARAKEIILAWPGYAETPLVDLSGIARTTDVASIHYKDEGQRFGLKSFIINVKSHS